MNTIKSILTWLSGKKSVIFGLCGVIVIYLLKEGQINENLALLIQSILTLLAGGASYATGRLVYSGKR